MVASFGVLMALAKLLWDAHYFDGYDPRMPLNEVVIADERRDDYRRVYFTYEAFAGSPVPALLTLPLESDAPVAAVVFLHGIGQKKEFIDEAAGMFAGEGLALATFDQYTQGERELADDATVLDQAVALRERGAKTVIETRRMVDYLDTRAEIDAGRLYLVGASYGAIMGATAAAFEKRFKAVVLTYGGGDFRELAGSDEVVRTMGPLTGIVGSFATFFGAPFDPVRYVDGISPRPLFFQNGNRDRIVVPAAAQALYDAAREPKEIKWYPSDHLDLSPEFIPIAVQDAIAWIKAQDAQIVAAGN